MQFCLLTTFIGGGVARQQRLADCRRPLGLGQLFTPELLLLTTRLLAEGIKLRQPANGDYEEE